MSVFTNIMHANRSSATPRGLTRYFFGSGIVLTGAFAYMWLWSALSQRLTGDELYAIGSRPSELISALNGGGIALVLLLIGFLWLFMTGFAARGAMLRQRDKRIADLEAKLNDRESR